MKKLFSCYATLFFLSLIGCSQITSSPTPRVLYKNYLNLELPEGVDDFRYRGGGDTIPIFASSAYFIYKAGPDYFEGLMAHAQFFEENEFNRKIYETPCDQDFPDNFSYWTEERISLEHKKCFTGIFFPYVHYIVYDVETKQVNHFVTGMQD